jgi:FAD/FMN-containing dehydrogenase
MGFKEELSKIVPGVVYDDAILQKYSRDASIFEIRPEAVVSPQSSEEIKKLVQYISRNEGASLTVRSGGTDMTGGPLSTSIVISMTEHFNKTLEITNSYAKVQPGVFYRDFDKITQARGLMLPSYPASREICTVGGMAANNSGGEKSLIYHKTQDWVQELKVVLADGEEYVVGPIDREGLKKKLGLRNFEGKVYNDLLKLLETRYDLIKAAKPEVSKNSAGYNLWDVWDRKTFDLTKLFVGSQGTLGIITEIKYRLAQIDHNPHMVVIFLRDLDHMVEVVNRILPHQPTSFESYDDHTLKLALKYFPEIIRIIKPQHIMQLMVGFLPEVKMVLTGGFPKLVLMAEFTGSDSNESLKRARESWKSIQDLKLKARLIESEQEERKYWVIRRESFNLLRHHLRGKVAAPFIDDLVVRPEKLQAFWPRLNSIMQQYPNLTYTIAGHIGEGNFHIIPLMNLSDPSSKKTIRELSEKVYDLVFEFEGSMTGEHNDGLIRSSYLPKMYGDDVYKLFEQTKKIMDPRNIFNPGKKIGVDLDQALKYMRTN